MAGWRKVTSTNWELGPWLIVGRSHTVWKSGARDTASPVTGPYTLYKNGVRVRKYFAKLADAKAWATDPANAEVTS